MALYISMIKPTFLLGFVLFLLLKLFFSSVADPAPLVRGMHTDPDPSIIT